MKKFVSEIAVSFFFTSLFVLLFYFFLEPSVNKGILLINSISIKESAKIVKEEYDFQNRRLINYPAYGTKYGTIKIPSINVEMAVYHGDTKKILMMGIGHYTGSYFPGEGGTIIYAGHNDIGYLASLEKIKLNDLITIETTYGIFNYQVYDVKIVKETDLRAFSVQNEEEILAIYTCFPINRNILGRRVERMIVYAKRVIDEEA